jgi:outer membrane protein OmpA-like peptidoglycan-associated protein
MKTNLMLTGAMILTMVGTGCATKKYVAKTMAPVEARVATAETKNADQDKMLTAQGQEIDQLQTSLSRTNERVTDADGKAVAAGAAAARAAEAASGAQRTADGATTAAAGALTAANTGRDQAIARANEVEKTLSQKVDATVKLTKASEETILFSVNQSTLSKDAKATLDAFAQKASGKDRFVIEVQGFTDKTGSVDTNTALSQKRAEVVARYLVNQHNIPLHMVTMMGSGYTDPVADDKTRDGRKQNRRVEVRMFAPEVVSLTAKN